MGTLVSRRGTASSSARLGRTASHVLACLNAATPLTPIPECRSTSHVPALSNPARACLSDGTAVGSQRPAATSQYIKIGLGHACSCAPNWRSRFATPMARYVCANDSRTACASCEWVGKALTANTHEVVRTRTRWSASSASARNPQRQNPDDVANAGGRDIDAAARERGCGPQNRIVLLEYQRVSVDRWKASRNLRTSCCTIGTQDHSGRVLHSGGRIWRAAVYAARYALPTKRRREAQKEVSKSAQVRVNVRTG